MAWVEEASIHRFHSYDNDGILAISCVTHLPYKAWNFAECDCFTLLCLGLFRRAKCKVPLSAQDAVNVLLDHRFA